ncbi:MAG TPA: Txe/YoeB family addiction module toxin [Micromonosporaceae bacterium]|jgi:toxin YoeB
MAVEETGQPPAVGPGSKARLVFTRTAWEQYPSQTDRRLIRRINELVADIIRNGHGGIGKPEPLRGELSGFWSRRIDQEHRLVYRIQGSDIEIIACRYHYQR